MTAFSKLKYGHERKLIRQCRQLSVLIHYALSNLFCFLMIHSAIDCSCKLLILISSLQIL